MIPKSWLITRKHTTHTFPPFIYCLTRSPCCRMSRRNARPERRTNGRKSGAREVRSVRFLLSLGGAALVLKYAFPNPWLPLLDGAYAPVAASRCILQPARNVGG
jgi:hypothetical protein